MFILSMIKSNQDVISGLINEFSKSMFLIILLQANFLEIWTISLDFLFNATLCFIGD